MAAGTPNPNVSPATVATAHRAHRWLSSSTRSETGCRSRLCFALGDGGGICWPGAPITGAAPSSASHPLAIDKKDTPWGQIMTPQATVDSVRTSAQVPAPNNRWRGDNRGGWSNSDYDRAFDLYSKTLDPTERIRHAAEMDRIFSLELPAIPHWLNPNITAHTSAIKGPVPRYTPDAAQGVPRVWEWEWRQ